jgi:hypothetical protein
LAVQQSELLVHVSLTSLHDDPPPAPPVVPPVVLEPVEPPEPVVPPVAALSSPPQRTSARLGNARKAATRIRLSID